MKNAKDQEKRLREDRNRELVKRMKTGESLTSFSSFSSWFPPRPTIEKDPEAVAKLYGQDGQKMRSHLKERIKEDGEGTTIEYGEISEAERIETQIRLVDAKEADAKIKKESADAVVIKFPGA